MSVVYRPARADELAGAQQLVVGSVNDLTQRHGFGAIATVRPPLFQMFSLQDDPDGLWVAEQNGEMLGYAFAWACGELRFLAELFVAPGQQRSGIGNELLQRAMPRPHKDGAIVQALITFAFNGASQGLYIRHGIFPKLPLYFVRAARARLQISGRPRQTPPPLTLDDLPKLAEIDSQVLGVTRTKHHRYLIGDATIKGVLLRSGGERIGYAYLSNDGHIGPLAVTQPQAMAPALQAVLAMALDGDATHISALIPGASDAALGIALSQGMRFTLPMMLMASRNFGDWRRYLPRNPLTM
ncbi:MAG: GNAT family N-acetyltransferase [Rhodospirillales bacterium]